MKTRVIFRKFKDEILALFPALAGDMQPYKTCLSYGAVGQHSAASVELISKTRPAKQEEYQNLKLELERAGYELKIAHRFTQRDLKERIEQTNS